MSVENTKQSSASLVLRGSNSLNRGGSFGKMRDWEESWEDVRVSVSREVRVVVPDTVFLACGMVVQLGVEVVRGDGGAAFGRKPPCMRVW